MTYSIEQIKDAIALRDRISDERDPFVAWNRYADMNRRRLRRVVYATLGIAALAVGAWVMA